MTGRAAKIVSMPLILRGVLLLLAASGALAPRLGAQSALYVEHHGRMTLVRKAREERPYVEQNGALVPATTRQFALGKAGEYLPVFVSIRNLRVRTISAESVDTAALYNTLFEFYGEFVSAHPLDDVFVLLDFTLANGNKAYFLREIGSLEANKVRWRRFQIRMDSAIFNANYELHLFCGGAEVLQSEQPADYREAVLARMVAQRIANRPDGPPVPFIIPPPEYPEKLKSTGIKGHAVVRLGILANGAVTDPVVMSASEPAFGESAVAALHQWRFLPRIKGGQPVAATVELPFDFAP